MCFFLVLCTEMQPDFKKRCPPASQSPCALFRNPAGGGRHRAAAEMAGCRAYALSSLLFPALSAVVLTKAEPPILFQNFLCSLFLFAFRKKKKRDKSLERIGAHGECKELISEMMAGNADTAGRTSLCKL